MGGKGQRRREKNFLAAHGGHNRLPPAPKASDLDALPSKLRRIISFMSPSKTTPAAELQGQPKVSEDAKTRKSKGDATGGQIRSGFTAAKLKEDGSSGSEKKLEHIDNGVKLVNTHAESKEKRKRKRKKVVDDLRFQNINQDPATTDLTKRERRKKFLDKRRKKHKKAKTDNDGQDIPIREEIKFGEVVEAPPKIAAFPKATKATLGASHERLRLQAVEAYRKRKGWVSRPGIDLPPLTASL